MTEVLHQAHVSRPAIPSLPTTASAPILSEPSTPMTSVAARVGQARWKHKLRLNLVLTDLLVLAVAMTCAVFLRFGDTRASTQIGSETVGYLALSVIIGGSWWFALSVYRTRDEHVLGHGTEEYRRVVRATIMVVGWLAIILLAFKIDVSRGYLAIAVPLGLLGLLTGRRFWRWQLRKLRSDGKAVSKALVIGGVGSASNVAANLAKQPYAGYVVSGVWVPDRDVATDESLVTRDRSIPVLGNRSTLPEALNAAKANAVVVTDTEHLGPDGLKSLAYELEGIDIDLMVAPNVVDVSGSRIHMSGVAGMPFLLLEEPQYSAAGGLAKKVFDKAFATAALIVASPILITAALAVKFTDGGPVFYRSERIGQDGKPFNMLKFRSMRVDADQLVRNLQNHNEGAGPLFKMKDDPRVTRVGRFLRRYSIDELPQLFNVLRGDMSMVGPRPPLRREVEAYSDSEHRRLLVRQGVTGLWQVSGRSDLDWENAVRLDLDYVDNWSMIRDLHIIWQTIKAVARSNGAY